MYSKAEENMNLTMTNEEFHSAWNSLSIYHAPEGYWDKIAEQRKNHDLVGRKAWIDGRIHTCIGADDDIVVFRITDSSEYIISGDECANIRWIKEYTSEEK